MSNSTRSKITESRLFQPSIFTILAILVAWQLISTQLHPRDFPSLPQLVTNLEIVFFAGQFDFVEHASITIQRILIAFVVSMAIGTTLGIFMGINEYADYYLTTPVMVVLTFPGVVWAFMAVMWFGITDYLVQVFVIAAIVTPYVTVNIWKGAQSLDPALLEMARAFEATTAMKWRHIHIPNLLPFIYASARVAFALSWKVALVAEIFGATAGVGYVIDNYFQRLQADMIIAWALPMMLLMFGVERIFKRMEKRSFAWRPELDEALGEAA